MDLKAEILKEHSKIKAVGIAEYIGSDPERFGRLMQLFLHGTYRLTQRAAWVVSICAERDPGLIKPYFKPIIDNLKNKVPDAVKRNTLRIFQDIDVPDEYFGDLADICFGFLNSGEESVAVKVFSISILCNITKKEPGLGNELRIIIEDQLPYASAGFQSRARKVLKKLDNLSYEQ